MRATYFVSMYTDGPSTRWNVIDRRTQEWVRRFPSKEEAEQYAEKLESGESPNMLFVIVDGVNKGELFKRKGRWHWRRGALAVETFAKGTTLGDVADWARKCCNGKDSAVTHSRASTSPKAKQHDH